MRGGLRGSLMLEGLMAVLIIALAMTTLLAAMRFFVRANTDYEASTVSAHLSQRLLEEIRLRRWDERTPTPPQYTRRKSNIGRDGGGESATDKTTYDDIDDFNGWTESPPRDPMMRLLPAFDDYTSSVAVRYLDITTLAPSGTSTDYKGVDVCTWRRGRRSLCLNTIITNR